MKDVIPLPTRTQFLEVPLTETYVEFLKALQNSGLWWVKLPT